MLLGRPLPRIDERGNRTQFEYDEGGNRVATILPDETPGDDSDNPRLVDIYDAAGRRTATTDPLGHTTQFVYCASGCLLETRFADGTSASNRFDKGGASLAAVRPSRPYHAIRIRRSRQVDGRGSTGIRRAVAHRVRVRRS